MLLPVEGIRFIECDAMAMPGKLLQYPAIIGGCAVPVGGKQAGAVKGDLHATLLIGRASSDAVMSISCCVRWAQLWRLRIGSNPLRTRLARRSDFPLMARLWSLTQSP